MRTFGCLALAFLLPKCMFGQIYSVEELDQKYYNWFNEDLKANNAVGASVDKVYDFIASKKMEPKKTVVVAVIDAGVDIGHEDLQGQIWTNEDEIPGNGIDDDNNGYVDDIHGWNFIGNRDGDNLSYENFEYTRIVKLKNEQSPDYAKAKELYDAELKKQKAASDNITTFEKAYAIAKKIIKENTGIEVESQEDLAKVKSSDSRVADAKKFLALKYSLGFSEKTLNDFKKSINDHLDYYLNLEFDPRPSLVGDDPLDFSDRNYGNADVKGPVANHGTAVAGIIAAVRNNDKGINGVASNVKIMVIRAVPDGDERDKDVAAAIMYAVDNGADIVNMSFGKAMSPQKQFVDKAVKYAEEKDVLLVHSSGNEGKNIDISESFPSSSYLDGSVAGNWLSIGASAKMPDEEIAGVFSNYGEKNVDLFAPGVNIITLDTGNTYLMNDGTSFSSPVVSGVAALLLSYYPDLTSKGLIDLLLGSSYKVIKPRKVLKPDLEAEKRKKVRFDSLSKSGGIVNAYNAFVEMEKRQLAGVVE